MALNCKVGSFAKSTGGNGTTQSVTIGFQAKAIIFWYEKTPTTGYTDGIRGGMGFCDASAVAAGSKSICYNSDDAGASSDTRRYSDGGHCIKYGGAAGTTEQASYVSAISSTDFTLTHDTNIATASTIHYLALGGSDITNTKADKFTTTAATGNQSITSLSFQPDFVFMLSIQDATETVSQTQASYIIGMASGSSNQGCICLTSEDARNPADTWRKQRTDKCLTILSPSTGAQLGEAAFTQFTSTGFDINWTTANTAAIVHFLAIKGGSPIVGNLLQPTSNGVQTYSTTASKTPKGVMLFSQNNAANTAILSHARLSIGGTDGTAEELQWMGDTDAVTPVANAVRNISTKTIGLSTEAATGTSSTTNAEADTDSFNSGNFKLNWTTTDATQREVLFFAFSEAVAVNNVVRALSTETTSISEAAFTRLAAKTRTRSETAIAISETRARLAAKNRPIATQTTTLSENVIRVKGKVKTLATETITVAGGTIARLLAKIRTGSDTIAVSETRNRLAAKNRALATQTTILSDSITRIKGKLKSLATETITLGAGTAARLSAKIRALSTQTVALSDSRTRLKGSLRPLATQSITVSGGTLARLKASLRTISQTTVLSDSSIRLAAKLRVLSTQTVVLSDARNRLATKLRVLSTQTVALADSVARLVEAPTGITRALSETVGLTDSVARLRASRVFLSETVPIAGVVARIRGIARLLPQTVPVAEQAARIKSSLRLTSQVVTTSDSITRLNALRRTVIQTTIIAENVVGETVGNLVRSMVETITVSDSIARRTAKLVILDQFITIAEQTSRLSTKLRAIPAQTITLSDSATNELNVIIKNVLKTISQVIAITDYAKIEVIKKSQRFRKILDPSIKRLKSNHPAWFLGTRGMHDHYEEFAP